MPRQIKLPGGSLLSIHEILAHSLYSAFVLSRALPDFFNLFDRARGDVMHGDARPLTAIHTSLFTRGYLPQENEMFVSAWRAKINYPMDELLLDWASDVEVEFIYALKPYGQASLLDLLHGSQTLSNFEPFGRPPVEDGQVIEVMQKLAYRYPPRELPANWFPIWMTWNAGFELRIDRSKASAAAFDTLCTRRRYVTWLHLDGIRKRALQ